MFISVIIPTYNRSISTNQAVFSVIKAFEQVKEINGEIIIVDDGSYPPFELIKDFNFKNISIIQHQKNSGPAEARNTGIKKSKGDWLAFLDSDDIWYQNKLKSQIDLINKNNITKDDYVAITCGIELHYLNSSRNPEKRIPINADSLNEICKGCWTSPGSTLLLPKQVFNKVGFFNPKLKRLEDYEWFIKFANYGGSIKVVKEFHVLIRTLRSNLSDNVEFASQYINDNINKFELDNKNKRLVKSHLALERSASYYYDNKLIKSSYWIINSFLEFPRLRLALTNFWNYRKKLKKTNILNQANRNILYNLIYDKKIKISLVIPYFNEEKSLLKTIELICSQTYLPKEVLFINSSSTDNSSNILNTWIKNNNNYDINFININQNSNSPSSSKNVGIKLAKYKWIAFMDCGLDFDNNWLKNQIKHISENINNITSGVVYLVGVNTFDACCVAQTYGYKRKRPCIPSTLVNKSIFDKTGLFIERRAGYDRVWPIHLRKNRIIRGININNQVNYLGVNFSISFQSLIKKMILYSKPTVYLKYYHYPYFIILITILFLFLLMFNLKISFLFILIYLVLRWFVIPISKSRNIKIYKDYPKSIILLPIIGIVMDVARLIGIVLGFLEKRS